ncbi:Uncharacterized protein APZ42_033861 [Daphnia magna]|uniref:Uncharacterized protein n=1 Tax=Daphnia magna TaxID=35525 RepID=A0A164KNH5_9CRUS|nr:Uncharacterized protein APZ42_033861 [Daphnia magna]
MRWPLPFGCCCRRRGSHGSRCHGLRGVSVLLLLLKSGFPRTFKSTTQLIGGRLRRHTGKERTGRFGCLKGVSQTGLIVARKLILTVLKTQQK